MSGSPVINEAVIVGGEWPADEVVGVPSGWKKRKLWVAPVAGSVTRRGGARTRAVAV
jgi:hypothetical protein